MSDTDDEYIKRLLFTDEPSEDENLFSFILRLAQANEITDIRWIYKMVCDTPVNNDFYNMNFFYKVNLQSLSWLTGIEVEKLENVINEFPKNPNFRQKLGINFSGKTSWLNFVKVEDPKLCPACLKENNYCRKIWELSFVTACPHHNCLLINSCQNCKQTIRWNRPGVSICWCGHDFRDSSVICVEENEVRLSAYFHRESGLPCCAKKRIFGNPINRLDKISVLKLLFFVGCHIYGVKDFSGEKILMSSEFGKLHIYLCQAVEIFDDWPQRYHHFIRALKGRIIRDYFIGWRSKLNQPKLPLKYEEYELFNQLQRSILAGRQFSFIHKEFLKCLRNPCNDDFDIDAVLNPRKNPFKEPINNEDHPKILLLQNRIMKMKKIYFRANFN